MKVNILAKFLDTENPEIGLYLLPNVLNLLADFENLTINVKKYFLPSMSYAHSLRAISYDFYFSIPS